jgi:hypothetical protein
MTHIYFGQRPSEGANLAVLAVDQDAESVAKALNDAAGGFVPLISHGKPVYVCSANVWYVRD